MSSFTYAFLLLHKFFLMINPYSVNLPKGRVYTDTRLGLDGVALFGYPY